MSLKINYLSTIKKPPSNIILFADEKFRINRLKKHLNNNEFSYINDLLKNSDIKKICWLWIKFKKKNNFNFYKEKLKTADIENLGAELYNRINIGKSSEYFIISDSLENKHVNFLGYFLHGLKLKSYLFKKYKSKKEIRVISINVIGKKNIPSSQTKLKFKALEEGTFYARDLVSEPGNILHPDEYAKRIYTLRKNGLKINIYDEKKLKKLGMHALLGVGQGSIRGNGNGNGGKGVCFDTGG